MANPEHVRVVKQGAEAIEDWRKAHPQQPFDLRGADLRRANLHHARLFGAQLVDANLEDADLAWANLFAAHLVGANLTGADLWGAYLAAADLTAAELSQTHLADANMTGAKLRDAKMDRAYLEETILANLDLSAVRGLESLNYHGPSVIDERTLRKSWPLPEVFLRGVGLSDDLIAFYQATLGKAIEFYSCFISYSSNDDDFAKRLHADLQDKGVRCWFAPEDLKIGDKFRPRIDEAIRLHDKLLLILSEHSVQSPWVEEEVEAALEKERKAKERSEDKTVLFPIRLDAAVMESDTAWAASIRRTRHIGDFRLWKEHDAYQEAFERLLRDLKSG